MESAKLKEVSEKSIFICHRLRKLQNNTIFRLFIALDGKKVTSFDSSSSLTSKYQDIDQMLRNESQEFFGLQKKFGQLKNGLQ